MSIIRSEDSKKWIRFFVVMVSVMAGYVVVRFVGQMGEWFDLESKIPQFFWTSQLLGIVVAAATYFAIEKNAKASSYLDEVYGELVKVVWPDRDAIVKMTVGIVIVLIIISGLFVLVDFIFSKILMLIY